MSGNAEKRARAQGADSLAHGAATWTRTCRAASCATATSWAFRSRAAGLYLVAKFAGTTARWRRSKRRSRLLLRPRPRQRRHPQPRLRRWAGGQPRRRRCRRCCSRRPPATPPRRPRRRSRCHLGSLRRRSRPRCGSQSTARAWPRRRACAPWSRRRTRTRCAPPSTGLTAAHPAAFAARSASRPRTRASRASAGAGTTSAGCASRHVSPRAAARQMLFRRQQPSAQSACSPASRPCRGHRAGPARGARCSTAHAPWPAPRAGRAGRPGWSTFPPRQGTRRRPRATKSCAGA